MEQASSLLLAVTRLDHAGSTLPEALMELLTARRRAPD
jgi:hypothetical protein